MEKKLMAPGVHIAKVTNYGTGTNSNGKNFVYLTFKNGAGETASFQGYLSPAAAEHTMKNLVTAGCNSLAKVAEGVESNAFDDVAVNITVEAETYKGETHAKVKWINPLTKAKDAAVVEAGKNALLQFAGQFELAKQKAGVKTEKAPVVGF